MLKENEKIVYFVRHGQSVDNARPVFQSLNTPLSETGQLQAEKIARRAKNLDFEAMIVSPQTRTKQTAEAITKVTSHKPEFSELFVECIKPSSIGGQPFTDQITAEKWRKWQQALLEDAPQFEDGETYQRIIDRADKALDFLKNHSARRILVVTHGFFLRTIVAKVLLGDLLRANHFRSIQRVANMQNTGLTVLKYQADFKQSPAWRLWIYNDHAHLAED